MKSQKRKKVKKKIITNDSGQSYMIYVPAAFFGGRKRGRRCEGGVLSLKWYTKTFNNINLIFNV